MHAIRGGALAKMPLQAKSLETGHLTTELVSTAARDALPSMVELSAVHQELRG